MKKTIILSSLVLMFGLFGAGYSYASYGSVGCQPIYGGGETCDTSNKFVLDKKVAHPESTTKGGTEKFVDNLSINDPKFTANQTVKFELTLTNTGNTTLNEVTLSDILPSYVTFVSGPGTYNKDGNTLTFKVLNLNANESRKFIIETKVKDANSLPNNQGITCVVNQAVATSGNDESRDNSQFCIEKTVTNTVMPAPVITQTPSTGAGSLALIGLIPTAVGGLFLRRRSK